jgi:uncharacterized membrane protein (UPF0127 family)
MRRLAVVTLALALTAAACDGDGGAASPTPLPAGRIQIVHEGGAIVAEVARTPEQRAAGLSNRASLPPDAGMLFVYETPRRPSFWMHQTLIPLDMVWIDAGKRVVQVHAGVQPEPGVPDSELRRYSPDSDVLYVLELNAGAAAAYGVDPGDVLQFDLKSP